MEAKTIFRPTLNQSTAAPRMALSIGKKNVSTSKASTSGMHVEGKNSTLVIDKINRIEKHLMERKRVLLDDDGKPLQRAIYLGDHNSDDEVESVNNDMARFLASNPPGVGYGTKSWNTRMNHIRMLTKTNSYDNDMCEGQEFPDNLHTIFDYVNIMVRGRNKK
nr:hypothetical protein [Tanacetum cinerariifolium]